MNIWGKLYYALFVPKCSACRSPLKGEQKDTCSPNCEAHMERLRNYAM